MQSHFWYPGNNEDNGWVDDEYECDDNVFGNIDWDDGCENNSQENEVHFGEKAWSLCQILGRTKKTKTKETIKVIGAGAGAGAGAVHHLVLSKYVAVTVTVKRVT